MNRRIILVLSWLMLATAPIRAAGPEGIWINEAASLRLRVSPCGAALCGTVVWLQEPRSDDYNPDAAKRAQPLLGSRLLSGMVSSGAAKEWKGTAYDPADGRSYAETMTLKDDRLFTQGCVAGSAVCHSTAWSKVN